MNLTNYFNNTEETLKTIRYKNIFSNAIKNNQLNILEYGYLINYFKSDGGNISNMFWFTELINKIQNTELNKICTEKYKNLLSEKDNSIYIDTEKIMDDIIYTSSDIITFSDDQILSIKKIVEFLINYNKKTFGFFGYAGTGKTTTIVELVFYLIKNNLIKSVAFTAPTNKAVSILKSKFRDNLKNFMEYNER